MVLIVEETVRFAINQQLEVGAVVNIVDQVVVPIVGVTRAEAIDEQAGIIIDAWASNILPVVGDDLQFDDVSWVDLDSAGGSTGSRSSTTSFTLPDSGASVGDMLPANAAVLVQKRIIGDRERRNGRMYWAGHVEVRTAGTNGNLLDAAALTALQTAMTGFFDDINRSGDVPQNYFAAMAVVHVTARDAEGNPTAGVATEVEELIVDNLLATQRRRLRP